MKSYMFEVGDSTVGSLGMVIRVRAESEEEALAKANEQLRYMADIEIGRGETVADDIEYCNIYLAPNLTLKDLVEGETEDLEEEDDG